MEHLDQMPGCMKPRTLLIGQVQVSYQWCWAAGFHLQEEPERQVISSIKAPKHPKSCECTGKIVSSYGVHSRGAGRGCTHSCMHVSAVTCECLWASRCAHKSTVRYLVPPEGPGSAWKDQPDGQQAATGAGGAEGGYGAGRKGRHLS